MAALGLVSGLLSAWVGMTFEPAWLNPPGKLFFLDAGAMPIGIFFAVAVAAGLWLSTGRPWAVPILLLTTVYAWSAAIHTATSLMTTSGDGRQILGSLAAGAVGAGVTYLGCALIAAELRSLRRAAATTAVGALAGLLYYLGDREIIDLRLLFVVWQPAVAFCIGSGLAARNAA
jgi:hypothetical protein